MQRERIYELERLAMRLTPYIKANDVAELTMSYKRSVERDGLCGAPGLLTSYLNIWCFFVKVPAELMEQMRAKLVEEIGFPEGKSEAE